jgi:6-pyruvoyl-tetrahydropterin synthase related domain
MSSRIISLSQRKSFTSPFSPVTIHIFVVIAVAMAVLAPMLFWGMPSARDLSNHFRFALPFYDALRQGNLYPGWLAESNNGFGDASFRFYPPALYYVLAFARALTGNWYAASLVTFTMLSALGAVGVYCWTREFTQSQNAMWAGIFYSLAPYHLNQFFQALLLAEFAAAAVLPFVFLFAERVCRERRTKDIAGLAVAYALLVLTHLPLTVIGSIALAFYFLFRIKRQNLGKTILALSLSIGLGLAASASYWVTMLFELKWIRADNVNPEPSIDYRHNFVLSSFSSDFLNVWWMNILLLFTAAMFWPAVVLASRAARQQLADFTRGHRPATGIILALASLLALTLFMATPLSQPLWKFLRPLQETQFPWRWLSISSLACSVLLGLSIPFWNRLIKTRKRPLAMFALGTIAISIAFSASHIIREARWITAPEFEQTLLNIPGSPSVYQWLPVWVHEPLPEMKAAMQAVDRDIHVETWSSEKRSFHVNGGGASEARVRTFFYPHWRATAGGRELAVRPDQNGAMIVALPNEEASITLEFHEPSRGRYAFISALIALFVIGGLLVIPSRMFSKSVSAQAEFNG